MLHIHQSNRFERLQALLLERLQRGGVFDSDQVVVPSTAVRRRLSLAVADAHGICAQVEFAFLARWLWRQIARVVPQVAAESPFDAEVLAWRVYTAFGDRTFVQAHPRLANYLDAADDVMLLELASRSAALLEQYITYRPDWLDAWAEGRAVLDGAGDAAIAADEAWQAALWRRIGAETGATPVHPGEVFAAALERLGSTLVTEAGLPATVHVFALPSIPPQHLRWLIAIGHACELHVYVLNPCREYWFDLVDGRRQARLARDGRAAGLEEGHRLLASWGRQAQTAIALLLEEAAGRSVDHDACESCAGTSLLARLQDGILELKPPLPGSLLLAPDDRSVEVHVAHSLTRQLEVLHDQLLGMFADDPTLRPGDILVAAPDIEATAPLVEAVFGTAPAPQRIPFAITGRGRSRVNAPARALLSLLSLASSRVPASELYALLQQDVVARCYGLDAGALQELHALLRASGLRWGLDAAHRADFDVPASARQTLEDALQRLFLAYCLPEAAELPFAGRVAAPVEGDGRVDGELLGRLWRFADALRTLHGELAQPRTGAAWAAMLADVLERFLDPGDDQIEDMRELREAVAALAEDMARGGCTEPLPLAVLRRALEDRLDAPARGGVPTGAVTFASIASLRSLPFRVVCVIGLDDGAFPTRQRAPEFDLIAARPRRGDRQRRDDERNLFLDLLLAARDRLLLAYTGRSIRDNAPLPPSVLVSELLDVVVPATAPPDADAAALASARARLVVEHPLQPFSTAAFSRAGDERLRSFDRELWQALCQGMAARAALPAATGPSCDGVAGASDEDDDDGDDVSPLDSGGQAPFVASPLAAPDARWHSAPLADLVSFFRLPCRHLLRRRLGIELLRAEDELQDDEPFTADRASSAALGRRLVPALLAGTDESAALALAQAGTELPEGPLGAQALRAELAVARRFAQRVGAALAAPTLPVFEATVAVDLDGQSWQVSAAFADLRANGLVRWRYGALRAADRLEAWLHHLVLCAAAPAGALARTEWHGLDGVLVLRAPDDPAALLADLLRIYRTGLTQPLHFFPKASLAYVEGGGDLLAAAGAFRPYGDAAAWSESHDPAVRLALRGIDDPLDGQFETLARVVFEPLRAHDVTAGGTT